LSELSASKLRVEGGRAIADGPASGLAPGGETQSGLCSQAKMCELLRRGTSKELKKMDYIGGPSIVGVFKTVVRKRCLVILILLGCGLFTQANGQSPGRSTRSDALSASSSGRVIEVDKVRVLIPDLQLFNHRGQPVRLYTDLIKDKVVLLNFFYTSCINVCLMQGENLSKIQTLLGSRLGKEVFFVSISMDPQTDTPQKLKYWAGAFGVKDGWTLVTGNDPEMNRLLKTLTGNGPGPKEMHSSIIFVGNDKTGTWMALDGLSEPDELVGILDRLINRAITRLSN